jgi:hypothetical protein
LPLCEQNLLHESDKSTPLQSTTGTLEKQDAASQEEIHLRVPTRSAVFRLTFSIFVDTFSGSVVHDSFCLAALLLYTGWRPQT